MKLGNTGRKTDSQTDGQTVSLTDIQTDNQTGTENFINLSFPDL